MESGNESAVMAAAAASTTLSVIAMSRPPTRSAIGDATTIHSAIEGRRYRTPRVRGPGSSKAKRTRAGSTTATTVWRAVARLTRPDLTAAMNAAGPATSSTSTGVGSLTTNVAGQNQGFAPIHLWPRRNPGELAVSFEARYFTPST